MADAQAASPPSFAPAATRGMLWLLVQNASSRFVVLASQLILAALVQPTDLGAVGIALTIYAIISVFATFGIDDVLLQRSRTMRFWFATATPMIVAIGCVFSAMLMAISPIIATVFHNDELKWLVPIVALALPLNALAVVPGVIIRHSMRFRFLAIYTTVELVVMQMATIGLALAGFGAASFIIPVPLLAAAKAAAFWIVGRPPITVRVRRRPMRHLLRTGSAVAAQRFCAMAIDQGDFVILGLASAAETVGLYYFAFRLAAMSVRALATNFHQVMFPILTHLSGDPQRQRTAAIEAAQLLSLMIVPVCFLQAAVAAPALQLLFGTKWQGAVPFVQILSLGLPFDAAAWIAYALFSARGEFRRNLRLMASSAVAFGIFATAGVVTQGAIGLAVAVSLFYAIVPVSVSLIAFRSWRVIGSIVLAPALLAGIAVGVALFVASWSQFHPRPLPQILVTASVSAIVYVSLVRLVMPVIFERIVRRVTSYLNPIAA